jgi:putative transposase
MGTTEKRVRRSRAQWRSVIARAARSPLAVAAFCRAEGISTASFYTWRRRLGEAAPSDSSAPVAGPGFLELEAMAPPLRTAAPWDLEVDLGAGVVLRLRRG